MEPTGLLPRAAVIEHVARSAGAERRSKVRAARHGVPARLFDGSARALHRSRILYAPPAAAGSGDGARNRVRVPCYMPWMVHLLVYIITNLLPLT